MVSRHDLRLGGNNVLLQEKRGKKRSSEAVFSGYVIMVLGSFHLSMRLRGTTEGLCFRTRPFFVRN